MVKLAHLCKLKLADNNLEPMVIHCAQLHFRLGDHYDGLWCFVITLGKFDLILEMLWLKQHDLKVSFCTRTLAIDFNYYTTHCLSQSKASIVYSCSSIKVNKDISFEKNWHNFSST